MTIGIIFVLHVVLQRLLDGLFLEAILDRPDTIELILLQRIQLLQ
jgi:hypothetical protein